jgi:uncharacterized protein with HEPN domain
MPRDVDSVLDMLQASRLICDFMQGITREAFEQDTMRQAAVIREIEILGEAARRISESFRNAHQEIPWVQIIGMRNILIHAYDSVDLDEVWEVTQRSIPELICQLDPLVPPEQR